jgi:hypothetical protein
VLGVPREILVQDGCGDVLAGLDAKRGAVHGKSGYSYVPSMLFDLKPG